MCSLFHTTARYCRVKWRLQPLYGTEYSSIIKITLCEVWPLIIIFFNSLWNLNTFWNLQDGKLIHILELHVKTQSLFCKTLQAKVKCVNAKRGFKLSYSLVAAGTSFIQLVWVNRQLAFSCTCRHFHGEDGSYQPCSTLFSSSSLHSTDKFAGFLRFSGTFMTAFPRLLSLATQSYTSESTLSVERKYWLLHCFLQCGAFEAAHGLPDPVWWNNSPHQHLPAPLGLNLYTFYIKRYSLGS